MGDRGYVAGQPSADGCYVAVEIGKVWSGGFDPKLRNFRRVFLPNLSLRTSRGRPRASNSDLRTPNLIPVTLQLLLQFSLEGLHVGRAGLITLLAGIEHQAAVLVESPLAAYAVAESHVAADHGARPHNAVDLEFESAGGYIGWDAGILGERVVSRKLLCIRGVPLR
jgi:hypothetical protein